MPATALATTTVSRNTANGLDLTAAMTAADNVNGMTFSNDGDCVLRVKNANASACTVTITYASGIDGGTAPTKTYVVPATTGDRLIGPFPTSLFGTTVSVGFSVGTSVTVAAIDLTN